jgi:hypothetical protein
MPRAMNPNSRPRPGAPRITQPPGALVVTQRKTTGWVLLGISVGVPAAVLYAERQTWWADPLHALRVASEQLQGGELAAALLVLLFFTAMFAYGVFWLLWQRELRIDLNRRRYVFTTGVWPWLRRHEGACNADLVLQLSCKRYSSTNATGDSGSTSGPEMEGWELRLALPGCREPLFLGEWSDHADAMATCETWRRTFPNLHVEDEGAGS